MFFKIKAKRISAAAFVFLALFFFSGTASAGVNENAIGWLWGGTEEISDDIPNNGLSGYETGVGWISLNSSNCDSDSNGFTDSTLNCGGDNSTTFQTNYGVNFPTNGVYASGYAWSPNVGWISFNESDLGGCPDGNCWAKIVDQSLKGWARVISIKDALVAGNSGGWSGFISLDGPSYTTTYDSGTGILGGYAWNRENDIAPPLGFGFIKFSQAGIATTSPPPVFSICKDTCGSGTDLSKLGATMSHISETKGLKACLYSWGCITSNSIDVTGDPGTVWAEGGSSAISLSGGNPNVATAMDVGSETITATYQLKQASVAFTVTSLPPKTCWRCDSVSNKCSSGTVYAATCPAESPIDSESECNTICKDGSWIEVAP